MKFKALLLCGLFLWSSVSFSATQEDETARKCLENKDPKACSDVVKNFTIACDTYGDKDSCAILGEMYGSGETIKKDEKKAFKYSKQGCDFKTIKTNLASKIACKNLAVYYFYGNSAVKQNEYEAVRISVQGCNNNLGWFCSFAGSILDSIKETDNNFYYHSFTYHSKGCELNSAISCQFIGFEYLIGMGGGQPNPDIALKYFNKGCRLGDQDSCTEATKIHNKYGY